MTVYIAHGDVTNITKVNARPWTTLSLKRQDPRGRESFKTEAS